MAVNGHDEPLDPRDPRIARLYREAAVEEVPPHLDHRLMAVAREALTSSRRAADKPRWAAWRVQFAVAAIAVVSVSLVTLVIDAGGDRFVREEPPATPAARQAPSEPAVEAARERAPVEAEIDRTGRAKSAAREERSVSRAPVAGAVGSTAGATPQAGSTAQDSAQRADSQRVLRDSSPDLAKATPPAAVPGPTEMAAAPAAPAPEAAMAAPSRGRAEMQPRIEERSPRAAAAPAAKRDEALRRQEMGALASRQRSPEVERLIAELEGRGPGAWIERITGLRRERRDAEADSLLAEFRRRFPEEPVPADVLAK